MKNKEEYNARKRELYQKNNEKIKAQKRARYQKNKGKYHKDYYKKNKERIIKNQDKYNKEYAQRIEVKEKQRLRVRTYQLFRDQLGDKCSKCSSMESLEIHHGNYKDFTIENCTLLCRACHRRLHVKE